MAQLGCNRATAIWRPRTSGSNDHPTMRSHFYACANNSRHRALSFRVIRPSVPSHLYRMTPFLFSRWSDFGETWHDYSQCEWSLLKRFSRSRGQRSRSYVYKCVNAKTAEAYISTVGFEDHLDMPNITTFSRQFQLTEVTVPASACGCTL